MSEYIDYLEEVFVDFGRVQPRRMFGGYGIFHKGLMFALVADDVLYLKADEMIADYFVERDLDQFSYHKQGKSFRMSYYMAPEEIFDDPEEAKVWAERSYAAAIRSNNSKTTRLKRPRKKK